MYIPVVIQWLLLAARYRSLSLPLIANPGIPLSGMVGVSKSAVFDLAGDTARQWILPWILFEVDGRALNPRGAVPYDGPQARQPGTAVEWGDTEHPAGDPRRGRGAVVEDSRLPPLSAGR